MKNSPTPSLATVRHDPLTRLTLLLFRVNQWLLAEGDRLAGDFGLTSAKWKVLGAIALQGEPMSAAAIGRTMGLSRQAALRQIDLLLEQNFLKRLTDPADARAPLHALTRHGQAAYEAVTMRWQARSADLADGLDARAIAAASALMEELARRLEETPPMPLITSATTGRRTRAGRTPR